MKPFKHLLIACCFLSALSAPARAEVCAVISAKGADLVENDIVLIDRAQQKIRIGSKVNGSREGRILLVETDPTGGIGGTRVVINTLFDDAAVGRFSKTIKEIEYLMFTNNISSGEWRMLGVAFKIVDGKRYVARSAGEIDLICR
jgi:hypothetical protein